jgi:aldehyde dehydrogenase (NAD+)
VVWKPASTTPLTAIAVHNLVGRVIRQNEIPEGVFNLIIGKGSLIGERLLNDRRVPLISLTGSTRVGKKAASVVAGRLGRYIMELGGNNAIILTENANIEMAVPAIVFGAVGTAGQRCTTTRRLIIHDAIYDRVAESLSKAYGGLKIGTPLDETNHVGPLINRNAVEDFKAALEKVQSEGGKIIAGGEVLEGQGYESGCYVTPALVEAKNEYDIVQEETFAPILYLIRYSGDIQEAIALHNDVPQGLSSAIFTQDLTQAEQFLSHQGSDCGLANVNVGTSGAEIGGAFGGEKETGGGRESGSDAWKAYMRRQTNTINFGTQLPLAQGIKFEI